VIRSVVTGVGGYLPEEILTNADLARFVDTSDEWIRERTSIRQRHRAAPDQAASDLAVEAARKALEAAGATIVQRKLGCPVGVAFDVQAVCSGFVYALSTADGFVARGRSKCALVIGAEIMTRLMDWSDRSTCVLFGDGAGAVVIEPGEGRGDASDRGLLGFALRADGTKQDLLYVDGGVSTNGQIGHLRMQGNQVFKHAVINISEAVTAAAEDAGVGIPDVDWFIPHQANQRILNGVASRLGLDESKVISTVAEHANTSAASIPLALAQGIADGRVRRGQLLLLEAMGGGLTWGACALRL